MIRSRSHGGPARCRSSPGGGSTGRPAGWRADGTSRRRWPGQVGHRGRPPLTRDAVVVERRCPPRQQAGLRLNCETVRSPRCSMSMAPREAKWEMRCTCWPGQSTLTQKVSLSPSRRQRASPHTGQWSGRSTGRPSGRSGKHGPADLGDDVPGPAHHHGVPGPHVLDPHLVLVVQGGQTTLAPPTTTGSSMANGVALPVRPIDTMIPLSRVVFSSGGNL